MVTDEIRIASLIHFIFTILGITLNYHDICVKSANIGLVADDVFYDVGFLILAEIDMDIVKS